jgi:hypothetical protein
LDNQNFQLALPIALSGANEMLISVLEERLKNCTTIDESKEIYMFLCEIRKDSLFFHFDTQTQAVDLKKRKADLLFYRIHKTIAIIIGLGLFSSSFFVYQYNPFAGGIFFGTGLGALGIGTLSLKSIINKEK